MKSKKTITIVIVLLLIITAGVYTQLQPKVLPLVEAYKIDQGRVRDTFEETSEVSVKEENFVYAKVAGNIELFDYRIGDSVKKGDIIAILNSEVIELEIKSLKLDIESMNAIYLEALSAVDNETINKARASVRSSKTSLGESQRNYDSNKALFDEGILSLDALQKTEILLKLSTESYNVALNDLNLLTKGLSEHQKHQYEAQISSLEAKLEILEKNISYTTVIAEEDGIVLDVFVHEGQYVMIGQSFMEIGTHNNLTIRSDVLTSDAIKIKKGSTVFLLDEDNGLELNGKVELVYPKAFNKISDLGISQKRIRVEIRVNDISQFQIGYELDAQFVVNEKKNVLRVPERAVFQLENKSTVFIIENNIMVLREVVVGLIGDDMVEILSGLEVDDLVILSTDDTLEVGFEVDYELEEQ